SGVAGRRGTGGTRHGIVTPTPGEARDRERANAPLPWGRPVPSWAAGSGSDARRTVRDRLVGRAVADALDIEQPDALVAYLRRSGRIGPDECPRVRVLAGGVSNRTVLVERRAPAGHAEAWVLKQALPKLRVPVDWFSSPARIHREALGLRWLARLAPPG